MRCRNLFDLLKGLAFLMLALGLCFPGLVSAAETTFVSVLAPSQPVDSGETFTVNVVVEPGAAIAGVQFNLTFDPSLVTVDNVEEGNLLTQDGASTYFIPGEIDNVAGTISGVAAAIISPGQTVSTIGTLAIITLTAGTGEGTCPLTLSGVVVGNIEGESVPVSVVDGEVTVNVNDAPVLNAIGDKSVNEGQLLEFTISASDPDGGPLTYSASNLPSGASFKAQSRTFSWTPGYAQAGVYPNIHFEVSDGELSDSEDITITVHNTNRPPTIASVSPNSGEQGETLEVTIGGTNFTGATAVSFGDGITVNSFTVVSAAQITANITMGTTATPGPSDISVTTPDGTGTLAGGFAVGTTEVVTVSIDAPDEVAPESDFAVNVNISEVVDFDACNYDVSFDASVLRLDDVTSGLIGSTTIPVEGYNEISPATYRVMQNVPGLPGVSGFGYLAVLHFHVVGSVGDSSAISLSNGVLANNLAEEITATWTGDSMSVTDTTPPRATITALMPDPTNDNTPTLTGTATDTSSNISSIEYKVDDGSWTAATASDGAFDSLSEGYTFTTSALSDGAHTVYVRATDSATNTTAEANYASDSFTVDIALPTVVSTTPEADATGVAFDTTVSVTFSEAMDASTITTSSFTLDGVLGSVSFDSGIYTATFTPSENLSYSATYTATLSTAISDGAGNPLAEAYSWSFTTISALPGDANGDGVVNALDVTKVERMIARLDAETAGADANQDGSINSLDITKVERIVLGLG